MSPPWALLALALSLLCACGSGSAARGRDEARAALEPELTRALESWREGGAAWELERETLRAQKELCAAFVDRLVLELVHAWDRSDFVRPGGAPGAYERARDELAALGPEAAPLLAGLLAVGDGVVAHVAAEVLARAGTAAVPPVLARLSAKDEGTRLRATRLVARLEAGSAEEEALARRLTALALEDPAWAVRAAALESLAARGARRGEAGPTKECARALLRDPEPLVAAGAAKVLGGLGDPRLVPALIDALERAVASGELPLARECQAALERLCGRKASSPEAWRRLWRELRAAEAAGR